MFSNSLTLKSSQEVVILGYGTLGVFYHVQGHLEKSENNKRKLIKTHFFIFSEYIKLDRVALASHPTFFCFKIRVYMKRIKFRIETSSNWTDIQMLEEIKTKLPNLNNGGEKQEALVIISIRKVPNKYIK